MTTIRTKLNVTITSPSNTYLISDLSCNLNEYASNVWDANEYADGCFDCENGLKFAVYGTNEGDGAYNGLHTFYNVDGGVLGIAPIELCKDTDGGTVVYGDKVQMIVYEDRTFQFIINNQVIEQIIT